MLTVVRAFLHKRPDLSVARFWIRLHSVEKYCANKTRQCFSVGIVHQNAVVLWAPGNNVAPKYFNLLEELVVLFLLIAHLKEVELLCFGVLPTALALCASCYRNMVSGLGNTQRWRPTISLSGKKFFFPAQQLVVLCLVHNDFE